MSIENDSSAKIAGVYEHPTREAPDISTSQIHADVAKGALEDAGISKDDIDGYATGYIPSAVGVLSMAEYLGLTDVKYIDSTESGGSSYITHVGHAANVVEEGDCDVILVTMGGRPLSEKQAGHPRPSPEEPFEKPYGSSTVGLYALAAKRHMHEYGTTAEQLAEVRVAASHHAQYNEDAMYQDPVTVSDVVESPMISDPLHLLDCCVVTDGGGAVVIVSSEVAADLDRECVSISGHGEALKYPRGDSLDLTYTGARHSAPRAYTQAGVTPEDIDYISVYDSFTITVLQTIEDLGFCEKGEGGKFVEGATLQAPDGNLPFNTDGGGLCNNHPNNQGGMMKIIETVRQLRGEANPEVQVPDCQVGLSHGTGGWLGTRMDSSTLVLERESS